MPRTTRAWHRLAIVLCQLLISVYIGLLGLSIGLPLGAYLYNGPSYADIFGVSPTIWIHPLILVEKIWRSEGLGILLVPPLSTSIWLLVFLASGLILKAAYRLDIGFGWFNRRFDVKKKPLRSLGFVAGALVAIVYWMAVIARRLAG